MSATTYVINASTVRPNVRSVSALIPAFNAAREARYEEAVLHGANPRHAIVGDLVRTCLNRLGHQMPDLAYGATSSAAATANDYAELLKDLARKANKVGMKRLAGCLADLASALRQWAKRI